MDISPRLAPEIATSLPIRVRPVVTHCGIGSSPFLLLDFHSAVTLIAEGGVQIYSKFKFWEKRFLKISNESECDDKILNNQIRPSTSLVLNPIILKSSRTNHEILITFVLCALSLLWHCSDMLTQLTESM